MNGLGIFLIVLIILLVIAGIAVGLYLWYREEQNKKKLQDPGSGDGNNNGNGGGTGGGSGGGGVNNGGRTITPLPGPGRIPISPVPVPVKPGNGGNNPPNKPIIPSLPPPDFPPVVLGNFTVRSLADNSVLSFYNDPGEDGNNTTINVVTAFNTSTFYHRCSWKNPQFFDIGAVSVLNALVSNYDGSWPPGYNPMLPLNIAANNINAAGDFNVMLVQQKSPSTGLDYNQSWVYDPNRKTWSALQFPDYCLYNNRVSNFNGYGLVTMKKYIPNDVQFQWELLSNDDQYNFCSFF